MIGKKFFHELSALWTLLQVMIYSDSTATLFHNYSISQSLHQNSYLCSLVIKHATSQNQPKPPTASQNHPQQPTHSKQEASVKFFTGVCKWNTCFPEFLSQSLECLVIRVTKNIGFERVVIYPFRILSEHILHCWNITL